MEVSKNYFTVLLLSIFYQSYCLSIDENYVENNSRQKRATQGTLVTLGDPTAITTLFNRNRGGVIPTAAKMPCLAWSSSLLATAQAKAQSCELTQSNSEAISFDTTQKSMNDIFIKWANEGYELFSDTCQDVLTTDCLDYKVIYNDASTLFACATAQCVAQVSLPSAGFLTVCEFDQSVNGKPYGQAFTACSACATPRTSCFQNLCSTSTTSCGPAPTPCVDTSSTPCTQQLCDSQPGVYLNICRKTCSNCDGCQCKDSTSFNCAYYAQYEYCTKYPDNMRMYCPQTCNFCSRIQASTCQGK